MVSLTFRSPRIETNIPVWLQLQENSTGQLHPGTVSASIINISKSGACLRIPKLLINGKHLFFVTLNSTHTMILQFPEDTKESEGFNISAHSIWMDSYEHLNCLCFKVGVCFTAPQKKLFEHIKNIRT
jgi:PilZ domain